MSLSHVRKGVGRIAPYFPLTDGEKFSGFLRDAFAAEISHRSDRFAPARGGQDVRYSDRSQGTDEYRPRPLANHLYMTDRDRVDERAVRTGGRSGGGETPCGNYRCIATQIRKMYP